MPAPDVVVFGQLARDLVLVVGDVPGPGGSAAVRDRREISGGKGVNQSVALAQLGMRPALVAVAGDDGAALLAGTPIGDEKDAAKAAAEIMRHGPGLVALAVPNAGNYFAWRGGDLMLPLADAPVADTTGAGDAFTAALIAGLSRGYDQEGTARLAVAAAGATVGHPGGRPELAL